MKICGITTKAITIKAFMLSSLEYMVNNGHEAFCISQYDDSLSDLAQSGGVKYIPVNIHWGNVTPLQLIKNIIELYKIFKKEKFDIIQYATSNAGLCACIAGWLSRVPVRIYCQWGISYTDYSGITMRFYKFLEMLTCRCSTCIQPDSFANLKFAIEENLYHKNKGEVIGHGSACGVDLKKYDITQRGSLGTKTRNEWNISQETKVFGFVGRVVPEKGINEILEAFMTLSGIDNILLMVVGPLDDVDRLDSELFLKSKQAKNIIYVGAVHNAAKYFAAFDYLLLPSYREGFGMTVLEAAAMGVPSIISNIKGPTDFVVHNYNGLICDVKSANSLREAILKACSLSNDEYIKLSIAAHKVVKENFDSNIFKALFLENREKHYLKSK